MNSYVKFIFGYSESKCAWMSAIATSKVTMEDYLRTISRADQLRFVLDQTIALSYLFWFYGPNCHELAITYAEWLKGFTKHIEDYNEYEGALASLVQAAKDMQSSFYGAEWKDVGITDINTFLFGLEDTKKEQTYPHSMTQNCAIPYLMHRNRVVLPDCDVFNGKVEMPSFRFSVYNDICGKDASIGCIRVFNYGVGSNFTAKLSSRYDINNKFFGDALSAISRSGYEVLNYLLKIDLGDRSFESIIRDIGGMCLHYDNSINVTPNFRLCYATSVILNGMFSVDFLDIARCYGNLPRKSFTEFLPDMANVMFLFLAVLNKTQGIKVAERSFFTSFFGQFSKEKGSNIDQIVNFVDNHGANVASVEELQAWKNSPLGSCEAIELISQTTSAVDGKDAAGETEDTSVPDDSEETKLDLSDIPDIDDADPALEAEAIAEEDEDTSSDADEGTDTTSSEEGTEDGNDAPEEGGEDPDNAGAGNAGADPGSGAATDTQASSDPEKMDASDDNGIVFELIPEGSETVDSVIFREELDQFITDTLTNPPKNMSPQSIAALTKLQSNWMHLLTVRTILSILGKLVSVPEKFVKTLNQMESNPNE